MLNFTYLNPVKVVFGQGTIGQLADLVPAQAKTLVVYGQGSIKRNGVYDQVIAALKGRQVTEFGGIEANPHYATCMKAVAKAKADGVDFLLAVGGGSVLDGVKFIAAAIKYDGADPWDILAGGVPVKAAVPIGAVLTLPATGSEMNGNAVISRTFANHTDKLYFVSSLVYPQFSVLDPATTFSLPERQTANGIVDTFVHVMEQYLTYPADAPLQDRQAEAILVTLIEQAPLVRKKPQDYAVRANLMWCATNGLNNFIGCGVPQDWATHMIGHELTALYGIDHAQSLAVVLPGVLQHGRARKKAKLLQYAERVWRITRGTPKERIDKAIAKTEEFFVSLGVPTRLRDYGIPKQACALAAERLGKRGWKLGEHQAIGSKEVERIVKLRA